MSSSLPKRSSTSMEQHNTAGTARKRRARYVWRACDVCRRRKGRCDGRKPCDFCRSRALNCHYSADSDPTICPHPEDHTSSSSVAAPAADALGVNAKGESISNLVLALQAQLDSLVAHVESCNETHPGPAASLDATVPNLSSSLDGLPSTMVTLNDAHVSSTVASSTGVPAAAVANTSKHTTRRYYGPTSPDYSLNAAEIQLRQAQAPPGSTVIEEETNPSLEDDYIDDDEHTLVEEGHGSSVQARLADTRLRQCAAQLPRLISKSETLRLLNVYHDVVGRLHPILDPKCVVEQAEACYTLNNRSAPKVTALREENFLILYLVLSIALSAEAASPMYVGKALYKSVENLIKLHLACEVSTLDHVLIALLAAIHHFFTGETRLAWRACGISGRMAMELGLHRRDVHLHVLRDEKERTDTSALLWSIVVLDRQWSAATGLPQNFQESDFDQSIKPPESAWYLRAMISYTFMSPKFEVPIRRVAAGATYDQDDAFEVLNFQVDQWLKKSIDGHSIFHPKPSEAIGAKPITDTTKRPSPEATLLYLRANAFRSIILRPFFFSGVNPTVSIKMIKPSMTIISDTIGVLSLLDSTTDIYKTRHPFFQHFLNSSCALLFLVVAYLRTDRSRSVIMHSADVIGTFPALAKREVERALTLATAYSAVSQTSNRLAKRLRHLEEQLSRPEFLQPQPKNTVDRYQQQRGLQRDVADKGELSGGGMGMLVDQEDFLQVVDGPFGDDGMNGMWWNDVDMLWTDWPSTELANNWI